VTITVGNTPPTPVIDSPTSAVKWQVGTVLTFSGHATDAEDGAIPASGLSWSMIMHHCFSSTNCHTHLIQTFTGVSSGSFVAPDHEYPCWIEVQLKATDSGGLTSTTSVRLDPVTVNLTFKTNPAGLKLTDLTLNQSAQTTPFSTTVVVGSTNSISAPSPQVLNRTTYYWKSWSDGGAQVHDIVAPATATTYTATYRQK
jgi:hypothetical protein